MRLLGTLLALLVVACSAPAAQERREPHQLVAERIVVLGDGSTAVVGIAARPRTGTRTDCRPGSDGVWEFFASRIGPNGRIVRTDVITEKELGVCGDLVLDATSGTGGKIHVTAWVVTPSTTSSDGHGPMRLTFARDGRTGHDTASVQFLWKYGPIAYASTRLRGEAGAARMWAPGVGYTGLRLEIERNGKPVVRVRSGALPADAHLYENWNYWYSLEAGADGVYGSGPYTRGQEGPYYFPIFKHGLDGRLDRSFGGDGVVLAHPPDTRHYVTTQVAVDRRGRVLAVGGADVVKRRMTFVMRFLRNGRLDRSFGRTGVVRLDLARATQDNYADTRAAIGVRHDGRLLVAGGIQGRGSTLWLLRPDGSLDSRFGRGGKVVLTALR